MTHKIELLNETFTLSAKLLNSGVHFPFDKKDTMYHNHFSVTVKTNKGRASFPFYGSMNDSQNGKEELDANDLRECLSMFFDDAIFGHDSFKEFCSNMGYDEDSRTAERTYKECGKIYDKLTRITSLDIYDAVNALRELEEANS